MFTFHSFKMLEAQRIRFDCMYSGLQNGCRDCHSTHTSPLNLDPTLARKADTIEKIPRRYSQDLKWRIVWSCFYRNTSCEEAAETFFISVRTVQRNLRQFYDLGSVEEAGTLTGRYRELSEAEEILLDIVFNNLGIYLNEIKSTFEELTGQSMHNSTLCREVRRLGLTRQSIHRIVLQRSEIERAAFKVQIELMDPSFFVWLDETGWNRRDSHRRMAYGFHGSPPVSVRLNLARSRLSAIAAMSIKGIGDVTIYEEDVDGQVFYSYLEHTILLTLQPFNGSSQESILIIDNEFIHRIEVVMYRLYTDCAGP